MKLKIGDPLARLLMPPPRLMAYLFHEMEAQRLTKPIVRQMLEEYWEFHRVALGEFLKEHVEPFKILDRDLDGCRSRDGLEAGR